MNELVIVPMSLDHVPMRVSILNACRREGTAVLADDVNEAGTKDWLARVSADASRTDVAVMEQGECVGVAGLVGDARQPGVRELYVFLAPAARGRGLGGRAVAQLLALGFGALRLDRIFLWVTSTNRPAVAVYERLGFVHEGTLRAHHLQAGRYVDRSVYGLLRDEWRIEA